MMRIQGFALAIACVFAGFGASAPAQPPALLPDGEHGPFDVVFGAPPPRAIPAPGSACEVANQYVTFIGEDRAPEVPGLFAQDGLFIGLPDKVLHGPREIATFYDKVHQPGAIPLSFIDKGDECIMELAGRRPAATPGQPDLYRLVAIDHFTIDADRKIEKLVIYFRLAPLGVSVPTP